MRQYKESVCDNFIIIKTQKCRLKFTFSTYFRICSHGTMVLIESRIVIESAFLAKTKTLFKNVFVFTIFCLNVFYHDLLIRKKIANGH